MTEATFQPFTFDSTRWACPPSVVLYLIATHKWKLGPFAYECWLADRFERVAD